MQVHGQKTGVGQRVYPAQRRAELQAVKGGDLAVDPHHIAQVQVAMAFAHLAGGAARGPMPSQGRLARAKPGAQRSQARAVGATG